MISRRSISTFSIVAIAIAAVVVFANREWHCGATIAKRSAGQIAAPDRVKHIGPVRVDVQFQGTILTGKGASTSSEAAGYQSIDLPGLHKYHFDHTPSVTRLRIRSDAKTVYDGPPVARPPAKVDGRLGVDFDWSDQSASVTVYDRCSIASHWTWIVNRLRGAL
jgi:hypothetical protein